MLVIDKFSRKPIYEQLIEGIEREVMTGLLREKEQLPSIRELSVTLGVNPNTIQKAFLELDRTGVILASQGRGCFVAEGARDAIREKLMGRVSDIRRLASELASAGIEEDILLSAIRSAYEENERKDEDL